MIVYYTADDKNMTEIALINMGLNHAGVRAELYWIHEKGFFEEFLGHKKG